MAAYYIPASKFPHLGFFEEYLKSYEAGLQNLPHLPEVCQTAGQGLREEPAHIPGKAQCMRRTTDRYPSISAKGREESVVPTWACLVSGPESLGNSLAAWLHPSQTKLDSVPCTAISMCITSFGYPPSHKMRSSHLGRTYGQV